MFSNLAYCPIIAPKVIIDDIVLGKLLNEYDTGHHDGLWKCLPLIGRVSKQSDFLNAEAFERAWEKRYLNDGEVLENMIALSELRELLDAIHTLPLFVTHAQILCQTADVGKHFDLKHEGLTYFDDFKNSNDGIEPASYKILLNHFNTKSFYVAEGFGKPNHFINLPEDTNTFVINEKRFPHGAIMPPTPKYIVSIFGILDQPQHLKLVNDSLEKYHEYAIKF